MQFLGVGYQEILVVLGLMLVVLGPERLPNVAYQIGRAVRTLQSYARAVRSEFSEEIGYIEDQYKTVRGELQTTRETFRDEQARFAAEMREATAPVQEAFHEVPQLASAAAPSNLIQMPERATTNGQSAWPSADPDVTAAPESAPAETAAPSTPPPGPPLVF